jgi:MFS family permease
MAYSSAYRAWVLLLIFLMMTSNYLDRTIILVLTEPISREFGLSNLQVGLLSGPAFAILYAVLGVPIAWLSERRNRVRIIAAAILVWSVMTLLCGLAANYVQLLAARVGVGIGEAGAVPPAQSLTADYFPPQTRASALSIHSFGLGFGAVMGAVIGGVAGEAWGWRVALMVVSVPGLVIAIAFLVGVREPPRGHSDPQGPLSAQDRPPFLEALRDLFTNAVFLHMTFAASIANFALNAIYAFQAIYFVRHFDLALGLAGVLVGMTTALPATLSMLIGGFLGDRLARLDARWRLWLPALGMGLAAPTYFLAFAQQSWERAAVFFVISGLLLFLFVAPSMGIIHNTCHPRVRATAIAFHLAIVCILGVAAGPVAIGSLADTVGLRAALMASCPFFIWGAAHFILAARRVAGM